ncbi:leukocyte surface antigen CD53-like [Oscarella lobularis]|uniref:leukocyte surface antigen CD53-like n=1 Tax=Oscarella lobularis TaxID=121494 RepID=UPI0033139246
MSSHSPSHIGICWTIIRVLLFLFNLMFWIAGGAITGFGAWILIKYRDIFELNSAQTWLAGPGLLIAIGVLIFVIAFFGCCGALLDNRCCLYTYSVFLGIMFVITTAGAVIIYVYQSQVKDKLENVLLDSMYKYETDESVTSTWNSMQEKWPICCGTHHWEDWLKVNYTIIINQVPISCCTDQNVVDCNLVNSTAFSVHSSGCYDKTVDTVDSYWPIFGAIVATVAAIELIGMGLACGLASAIKKNEYEYV